MIRLKAILLVAHIASLATSEMQDLCYHIQKVVRDFFPYSVYTAIGGWIFLRYINPAIISPDIVDLELPEESRKALLLISKVCQLEQRPFAVLTSPSWQLLQALSNNIRFKEPGMKSLNGFIGKVCSCVSRNSAYGLNIFTAHPRHDQLPHSDLGGIVY